MDQKLIDERCEKLQEYLNTLVGHLTTRSTPYFEQIFCLPPNVVVNWIKHYKSFEGVRAGKNVEIFFDSQENIKESPERRNIGLQMNKE